MRLPSVALLIALVVPLSATAQPTKQVEVTNFPDPQTVTGVVEVTNDATNPVVVVGEVEVTNLPAASAPPRFQLVGFTAATFTGDVGLFGLTLGCQEEFAKSRLCVSEEVMETVTVPALTGDAWVRPSFQPHNSNDLAKALLDASGLDAGVRGDFSSLTCFGWAETGRFKGLVVTASGGFHVLSCGDRRGVACCALVP